MAPTSGHDPLHHERAELLEHLERLTDVPTAALEFVWLALLVLDFTRAPDPGLQTLSSVM
ncbi:hypothetical protein [Deinococcus navajonensis]|uniref:Uncharacterized protein n=1 Tax=Deinococcus navajonensis TaxID=309884 RepID=A0ABV8XHX3_9DEIO